MPIQFIRDIHAACQAARRPVISFEFFPPKTDEGDRNLLEKTLPALLEINPDFCSVTYGAGGGTREKTLSIVDRIQRVHGLTTMSHLTCVNATGAQIRDVLDEARRRKAPVTDAELFDERLRIVAIDELALATDRHDHQVLEPGRQALRMNPHDRGKLAIRSLPPVVPESIEFPELRLHRTELDDWH